VIVTSAPGMDASHLPDAIASHAIAPARVLRGPAAWRDALPAIDALVRRPLLLGRSAATRPLRDHLHRELSGRGITVAQGELRFDCCQEDLDRLQEQLRGDGADGVIAIGGGKVLDAGKLLAHRLHLPVITVPTSAATCAGWTALANLYSPAGAFRHDVVLERCPDLLVFDHELVRQAPRRTLASGIGDAMAKWYEASVSSGGSGDGMVQQAVQMARVLRDQLLLEAEAALRDQEGAAWVRVAEACGLTAGVVGGLGGAGCRTVAAHAVHNGITQLPASHAFLHGEKVAFGILVQLRLEELVGGSGLAAQARRQLLPFFRSLGLPVALADLGLGSVTPADLGQVCRFACQPGSDLHQLPFPVREEELLAALMSTADERQPA
jgi:glycerol dehydrogenase